MSRRKTDQNAAAPHFLEQVCCHTCPANGVQFGPFPVFDIRGSERNQSPGESPAAFGKPIRAADDVTQNRSVHIISLFF